jgi:hypothetical protein
MCLKIIVICTIVARTKRVPSMSRNKAQRATSRLDAGGGLMDPVVM